MNSKQAKQIDLPDLLSRLGFEPDQIKRGGDQLWYRSPFRAEKEPSFQVSRGKVLPWVWNDFADSGGTVIDFVMRYKEFSKVAEALAFLETIYGKDIKPTQRHEGPNLFSSYQQAAQPEKKFDRELEFLKVQTITNPVIYRYLESRKIPKNLAHLYLREIRYRNKKSGKIFFAFGMENRSKGYEIRVASDDYKFKSALINRDITIYPGSGQPNTVNVFEGMLDFLSLLTMVGVSNLSGDSIIMHSLSSYKQTIQAIKDANYSKINTFLDNNPAGHKTTKQLIDEFEQGRVVSKSELFEPHIDINDALQANQIPDFLSSGKSR